MLKGNGSRLARTIAQFVGYLLAIGLLVASIWYAMRGQRIEDWWILLRADPWVTVAFFVTVIASGVLAPGIMFWFATRPFVTGRPLSLLNMQALIAAGALLNYTPFKAGLIGRVAYLKHFHGVGYRAAVFTHAVILIVFLSSSLLTVVVTVWRGSIDAVWCLTSLAGILILAGLTAPLLRLLMPSEIAVNPRLHSSVGALIAYLIPCFMAQILGLFVTALRWWLIFRILERPIALADAWMAAVVHMVSLTAGPANGIGLREWLIGISGKLGGLSSGLEIDLRVSMSAALIDRAVEAAVLVVLGLLGLAVLRLVYRGSGSGDADATTRWNLTGE